MTEEFKTLFESPSSCCGELLAWEWYEDESYFTADCICTKRYVLVPQTAIVHILDMDPDEDYIND